jgi:hypothetical protein
MWEPRRLTTLWASMACYRNSFTFTDKEAAEPDRVPNRRNCLIFCFALLVYHLSFPNFFLRCPNLFALLRFMSFPCCLLNCYILIYTYSVQGASLRVCMIKYLDSMEANHEILMDLFVLSAIE